MGEIMVLGGLMLAEWAAAAIFMLWCMHRGASEAFFGLLVLYGAFWVRDRIYEIALFELSAWRRVFEIAWRGAGRGVEDRP